MTDTALARRLGGWASSLTVGEIPAPVAAAARRAIIDTIAVMTAGLRHTVTAKAITAFDDGGGVCHLVNGGTASAASAALINGTAAHAYDLDDTSYTGIMHGSAVILPAVLAAVEETGADDAAALAAFVAGSEIAYALGDIVTHDHYFRGWWSTVTLGLIGATAAAARVYGLDVIASTQAVALAASIAGGGKAVFGTDGKPFLVGMTARTALDLAKAARGGLCGPENAFEDSRGFIALLNNGAAAYEQADSLGKRWRLTDPGLLLKRYPVCSGAHALVEQTVALCHSAKIEPDQIAAIECHVPSLVNISLVYDNPQSAQQAQFSLPYAVACAVHHAGVTFNDLSAGALANPDIRAIMAKVQTFVDPELSSDAMRAVSPEGARVALILSDGRRLEGFCPVAYGMPARPLSNDDLRAKFEACVGFAGHPLPAIAPALDNLFALGRSGAGDLSTAVAAIWSIAAKGDPMPPRLAQLLPEDRGVPALH